MTLEEVKHVAALAKLSFNEDELAKIAKELDAIVGYVEQLKELDIEGVPETSHVLNLHNVFREDQVEPWLTPEQALQNAPAQKRGYFSVPKVIG
ncbi:MAG: Asp-tRNA(Asn)/Glu-tRNA(Gln) amidotransferase subunit GatC [candidate division KSB1 bacterium]|nr:Asp-tRNA(Asn)/Glu-tRNA(Gln) amidotransferase subunit GatC [candidate division KSB1 bacterium]